MTEQQKQDLFFLLQKFCQDNIGNRMNEWIIESFLNRAYQKLEAIQKAEQMAPKDVLADIDKMPFPS